MKFSGRTHDATRFKTAIGLQTAVKNTLTRDQLVSLDAKLRDVHRELRVVLSLLPVEAQTASGLARHLRVERTTCQRAVAAATQAYSGVEIARQLPGPRGLRLLATAVRRRFIGSAPLAEAVAALGGATDAYDAVTRDIVGSRSELLRLIEGATRGRSADFAGGEELKSRRALFEAAAALTGRASETWVAAHIYEPLRNPAWLMQTRAHGLLGHSARDDAVPLTFHVIPPDAPCDSGGDLTHEPNPDGDLARSTASSMPAEGFELGALIRPDLDDGAPPEVLRSFSTTPLPIVRSHRPQEFLIQTVERHPAQPAVTPFDLLFAMRGAMPHPRTAPSQLEEIWALINFPVRRLLFDVFLHRDLARDCIPGLDVHLWRPDFAAHVGERWQTRFSHGPNLQVLGSGLSRAATPAHGRHVELLKLLFDARGLDPAEYVGFRCESSYPMWRTGYRLSLDFGGSR